MSTTATKRGCGYRQRGGIYAECRVAEDGRPIEYYLLDPAHPIGGICKVGVSLVRGKKGDVAHILDWVGKTHYPYPVDFIEEARAMGVSRRIPKNFDFAALDERSRLILVHEKVPSEISSTHLSQTLNQLLKARERHCRGYLFSNDDAHLTDMAHACSGDHWNVGTDDDQFMIQMWPLPHEGIEFAAAAFLAVPVSHVVGIASPVASDRAAFDSIEAALVDIPFEVVAK